MIVFNTLYEFELTDNELVSEWLSQLIENEGFSEGEINYIFCSDEYLLSKNIEFLNHNTLTDVISFDYTMGRLISGDVYISIERVKENSAVFNTSFKDELHRVMAHGLLHYCGYRDKLESDISMMRSKEDYYLSLRKF